MVIYRCEACGGAAVHSSAGDRKLDEAAVAAVSCDARIQNTAEPKRPNRQTIPPSIRRAVLARDRHRCRAPGCGRTRFLEVHHIIPRDVGGSNRPENLVSLCSACHRLIHDEAGGRLRDRLRDQLRDQSRDQSRDSRRDSRSGRVATPVSDGETEADRCGTVRAPPG
jgi:5-methylcytosine-specific restriction endonuclease McrA